MRRTGCWLRCYESVSGGFLDRVNADLLAAKMLGLEADNAIALYRKIMGATNPAVAEEGTIRKTFALSIDKNTVHGSDSEESAKREIEFFFSHIEIVG